MKCSNIDGKIESARYIFLDMTSGRGPLVVSTAAFHARVRGSFPGLGGLKETKMFFSPSTRKTQYCGAPL